VGGLVLSFVLSFSDLVMPSVLGGGSVYVASMALADMIKVNAIASAAALALLLGGVGLGAYGSLAILAASIAGPRGRVRES
jgi:ABC-type spermidine/putrescine transport system permease subunit II